MDPSRAEGGQSVTVLEFDVSDVPDDIAPTPEYACSVCGVALEYSGRGRKPTKCADHKRGGGSGTPRAKAGNPPALAKQAAAALGQLNGLICIGLSVAPMPYRLPMTASAIATANEAFEQQAAEALATDPKLARLILRGGAASGKVALLIAYGMMGAAVVPVAIMEYKENLNAGGDSGNRPDSA